MERGSPISAFLTYIGSMIIIMGTCISLGVSFLYFTTYKYKVTMEVAPLDINDNINDELNNSNLQIFNKKIEGRSLTPFITYIHNLEAYKTAEILYEDDMILRAMFPDRWDSENERWIEQKGPFLELWHRIAELVGYPVSTEAKPGREALWQAIRHRLIIEEIDESMSRITIYVTVPSFGIHLLNRLHDIANEETRQFVEKSSTQRLTVLNKRYDRTANQGVRYELAELLVTYERMFIMTQGGKSFAAGQFQEPVAEFAPSRPNPPVILSLAAAGGFILFLLHILLLKQRRLARKRGPVYLDDPYKRQTTPAT